MIHKLSHFSAYILTTPTTLGLVCMLLVIVPILGIWAVHKYGWEHWEPFGKKYK